MFAIEANPAKYPRLSAFMRVASEKNSKTGVLILLEMLLSKELNSHVTASYPSDQITYAIQDNEGWNWSLHPKKLSERSFQDFAIKIALIKLKSIKIIRI